MKYNEKYMDLLKDKFNYNFQNENIKEREQALRNAYILYGFEGLKKKLATLQTELNEVDANKLNEFYKNNLKNDINFVEMDQKKIEQIK